MLDREDELVERVEDGRRILDEEEEEIKISEVERGIAGLGIAFAIAELRLGFEGGQGYKT